MASALSLAKAAPAAVSESSWQQAGWLPCRLTAEIPIRGFTVGDLLSLEEGSVVYTGISAESDSTVSVNGVRVGCGKLDIAGERLAVRLSELL